MPNSPEPSSPPPPQRASVQSTAADRATTILNYQPSWPAEILPHRSPWKLSLLSNAALLLAAAVIVGVGMKMGMGLEPLHNPQISAIRVLQMVSLAVSLQLIVGLAGCLSLGHAAFFAFGSYLVLLLFNLLSLGILWAEIEFNLWNAQNYILVYVVAVSLGLIVLTIIIWLLGYSALRRHPAVLPVLTLAAAIFVDQHYQTQTYNSLDLIVVMPVFTVAGLHALLTVFLSWRITHSDAGRAIIASREDGVAASTLGIDPAKQRIRVFIFGCILAGSAGLVLPAPELILRWDQTSALLTSLDLLAIVIIAGRRSISGVVITTIVLSTAWLLVPYEFRPLRPLIYAVVMLLFLRFRPQGIFGEWEITHLFKAERAKEKAA